MWFHTSGYVGKCWVDDGADKPIVGRMPERRSANQLAMHNPTLKSSHNPFETGRRRGPLPNGGTQRAGSALRGLPASMLGFKMLSASLPVSISCWQYAWKPSYGGPRNSFH